MTKYDDRAGSLQRGVWADHCDSNIAFNQEEIGRATVHGRMDLVLIVSHLSSLNEQTATIRRLMWVAVTLLFIIAGILAN